MNYIKLIAALIAIFLPAFAWSADGVVRLKSARSAKVTMDRLESVVKEKEMVVFARIDHASGAAKIGKKLRATELLIFGSPAGGTPFIECQQTVGLDLPLKVLVWEDGSGQVWLGYNDPSYIAQRHGVPQCPAVEPIKKALASFAQHATTK